MTSSKMKMDARRRTYVRLIGEISHALNQALAEENVKRGLTITEMARILKKSKSHISRKLHGSSNMTLETLADLAFALNRPVKVLVPERDNVANTNHKSGTPDVSDKPPIVPPPIDVAAPKPANALGGLVTA